MAYLDQTARDLMACLDLIPWQEGKPLCWDVTVICPLANSYLQSATASAGAVAELAATCKVAKYSALEDQYIFQPIAVESLLAPTERPASSWPTSVGRFRVCLETTGKLRFFCFNAFLFCYFVSILLCCTIVLSWTTARTISLSILFNFFNFFPTLVFRELKKK